MFDNIRVDHILNGGGHLMDVQFQSWNTGLYGQSIKNVTFKDISYGGSTGSIVAGRSATQSVSGVRFENVIIGGRRICSAAAGNIAINQYVYGVTFVGPAGAPCVP